MAHVMLLTWRNMETGPLKHFITRTLSKDKHGGVLSNVYFDSANAAQDLRNQMAYVRPGQQLTIYISGHGGVGNDFITDDKGEQRKTLLDLLGILVPALKDRATSPATCADTKITMVSCYFGRATDCFGTSPAVKLHAMLAHHGVYVELTARTLAMAVLPSGRKTVSLVNNLNNDALENPGAIWEGKTPYTKIRCTFNGGKTAVVLKGYGAGPDVDAEDVSGKRLIWGDYVCNALIGRVRKNQKGTRESKMMRIVFGYESNHNPSILKAQLEGLLDNTGADTTENFLMHRNPLMGLASRVTGTEPDSAGLVRALIGQWPG